MGKKISKMILMVTMVVLALTAPGKVFAGPEQIVIELGADLIHSLFGSSKNPQEVKIQQLEAKLASNVRTALSKDGYKVGEVKWEGMVKFADNFHVAFFSVIMNGKDGCYYYILERGKTLSGNEPEDMKYYNAFLPMTIAEKKSFLRMYFEKYANFKIPDDIPEQFAGETAKPKSEVPTNDFKIVPYPADIPISGFAPNPKPR